MMDPTKTTTFPFDYATVVKMKSFDVGTFDIFYDDPYQLVHDVSDKVLDIYEQNTHDGANVQIWTNHRGQNQLWIIHPNKGGTIKLINPKSGKALDVGGDHTSDGSNVQIHTDNGSNTQRWHLKQVGDGVYKLIHSSSGKALDVTGDATVDGTNVQIWSENNGNAQRWRLVRYQNKGERVRFDLSRDNIQLKSTSPFPIISLTIQSLIILICVTFSEAK